MRISDWSSDVCSSDLGLFDLGHCSSLNNPFWSRQRHIVAASAVFANRQRIQHILLALGHPKETLVRRTDSRARGFMSSVLLAAFVFIAALAPARSEEHTSELQSLMRISYAVFCLNKKK